MLCGRLLNKFNQMKCLAREVSRLSSTPQLPNLVRSITDDSAPRLSKETAKTLVIKLTEEERTILLDSLKEFQATQMKEEYRGQLAAFRWRSKFGRPSKVVSLGDVDPTGSYCPVPEDWLLKKCGIVWKDENPESVPKPNSSELIAVAVHNAIPFVGFGFLDNFIMILCGDYIEMSLGSFMVISTMAAAALGNTISDIMGLGSAWYVEQIALKVGMKPPALTPMQLDMGSSRLASNLGRVLGISLGCFLGMFPLLFLNLGEKSDETDESNSEAQQSTDEKPVTES